MVILAELADHRSGFVDGAGDENGIFSMCGVPITPIEYPDSLVVL